MSLNSLSSRTLTPEERAEAARAAPAPRRRGCGCSGPGGRRQNLAPRAAGARVARGAVELLPAEQQGGPGLRDVSIAGGPRCPL